MKTNTQYGIYMDMPFEEYLADPSLSKSGMKDLMISPLTYWVNSHLNPDRQNKETSSMSLGTAVHHMILDGAESYLENYAIQPEKKDYPNFVDGVAELKTLCKTMGLKTTGTISDLCKRILQINPHAALWPEIKREFEATSKNKQILKCGDGETVNRIAAAIGRNEPARNAFCNGFSEVSVLWPDPVTGIPMKARFDYLKQGIIVELKTFNNTGGFEVGKAVAMATVKYGYHLQAIHYLQAAVNARQMIQKGMVYGADDKNDRITKIFEGQKEIRFFFVFVETSKACNVIIREYKNLNDAGGENLLYQNGKSDIDRAKDLYIKCREKFGKNPWAVEYTVEPFVDEMFPAWSIQ